MKRKAPISTLFLLGGQTCCPVNGAELEGLSPAMFRAYPLDDWAYVVLAVGAETQMPTH